MRDMKSALTPQQIVAELERNIVGQSEAKRAVAIALRALPFRLLVEEADLCTRAPHASTHMQARTCTALRA